MSDPRGLPGAGAVPVGSVAAQACADGGPDLRLAPFVGALWLGQAGVLLIHPSRPGLVVAGGGAVLAGGLMGMVRARLAPPSRRIALLVAVCGLGLGVTVGAGHLARLHPDVLERTAQEGAVVRVVATVTGDPRMHVPADDGGRPMAPSWSVPARLGGIVVRGRTYSVRVPVLLRGDEVRHLRYGSDDRPVRAGPAVLVAGGHVADPEGARTGPGPLAAGAGGPSHDPGPARRSGRPAPASTPTPGPSCSGWLSATSRPWRRTSMPPWCARAWHT